MKITISEEEVRKVITEWAITVFAQGDKVVKRVTKSSSYNSGEYEITVEHGFSVGGETSDKD